MYMRKMYEKVLTEWGYKNIPLSKKDLVFEVIKQNIIVADSYRDLLDYVVLDNPKEEKIKNLFDVIIDYDEYQFESIKFYFDSRCIREIYQIVYKEEN